MVRVCDRFAIELYLLILKVIRMKHRAECKNS